ncbi:MAG: LysR family transcriptional regulator protein [Polyangiaceae bacterium]|jgi:DNA-binding transcriptional LysR family regulator|nr:LysR family transcriptional regulator protein [Polyangiaceae bacterium]
MLQRLDLSRVDLNLLVLFEAVERERHVGRAAKSLHLSPSAISHGLARLRRLLQDPLFLKHPKGVVPTERASELTAPIADVLQRVRGVLANAEAFDAQRSTRRFTIGAPDAVFTSLLPSLMGALAQQGPRIDLNVQNILPQQALASLDARQADLVIEPLEEVPPRFRASRLYDEDFAIAMRVGHPLGSKLTISRYCACSHVLVSGAGDPHGNVDVALEKLGRTRRVAATVPHFLLALALVAETDLLAAVPRLAAPHARRLGVALVEPPAPLSPLTRSSLSVIATESAMADAGVAWLFRLVASCATQGRRRRR